MQFNGNKVEARFEKKEEVNKHGKFAYNISPLFLLLLRKITVDRKIKLEKGIIK